jgi:hypothetical protein
MMGDLASFLPCRVCGEHLAAFLAANPLDAPLTRAEVWDWTRRAHNSVNEQNGKPALSNDEALALMKGVYTKGEL